MEDHVVEGGLDAEVRATRRRRLLLQLVERAVVAVVDSLDVAGLRQCAVDGRVLGRQRRLVEVVHVDRVSRPRLGHEAQRCLRAYEARNGADTPGGAGRACSGRRIDEG